MVDDGGGEGEEETRVKGGRASFGAVIRCDACLRRALTPIAPFWSSTSFNRWPMTRT